MSAKIFSQLTSIGKILIDVNKNISSQCQPKEIVMIDVGQQTLADANKKLVSTSVNKKT